MEQVLSCYWKLKLIGIFRSYYVIYKVGKFTYFCHCYEAIILLYISSVAHKITVTIRNEKKFSESWLSCKPGKVKPEFR